MPFILLDAVNVVNRLPGFKGRFIHTEKTTIIFWEAENGAVLPEHHHPHEQISEVTEGEFELTIGDETRVLKPGSIAIVPPNVIHSGKALTYCRIKDIFCPVREDYKTPPFKSTIS